MLKNSMKKFFGAALLLALLPGCFDFGKKKVAPSLVVVNVLDKEYYDDCHIPGSIHVPMAEVMEAAQKEGWTKDTQVVVYCANYSCTASSSVCKQLVEAGYENACAYEAGTAGWAQAGLPVEGPAQSPYLTQENKPLEDAAQHGSIRVISTEELQTLLSTPKEAA
ncbi:rhodanese-like domain-containing protein [bacterium]|nr:rhodanese-like domain-containing protein [bacterium]